MQLTVPCMRMLIGACYYSKRNCSLIACPNSCTGRALGERLWSGVPEWDVNLSAVRTDKFGNIMIMSAPSHSEASVVLALGWPRRLVADDHGGFLVGNLTCAARVSNMLQRSAGLGTYIYVN
jgi:hypothetical protein